MPTRPSLLIPPCLALLSVLGCSDAPPDPETTISAVEALAGGDIDGYARALEPRPFDFPRDHGPHPDFKTEWWYFTGHLTSTQGRRFGFQLTFFRSALAPPPAAEDQDTRASAWATRQLYLAHFALTDIDGERFLARERFSRGAAGLAGAESERFRVWLEDWSVESAEGAAFPWRLRAALADDDGSTLALDLELDSRKPKVLHGDQGLSRKGEEPGNASYYYSFTRLDAAGRLSLGEEEDLTVTGSAWLDREWSTSVLSADQVGWDWFSLQLDDDRELMLFQLRRRDGTVEPASHGTLVAADGSYRHLQLADFELEVEGFWTSPRSGATYPAAWRLRLPGEGLDLELRPLLAEQELSVSFRYWEGAITARGTHRGREISGRGYVELVGYEPSGR